MAKRCEHRVVLLGNRDLSSGRGVCADCVQMVPVDIRDPQYAAVFALVKVPASPPPPGDAGETEHNAKREE